MPLYLPTISGVFHIRPVLGFLPSAGSAKVPLPTTKASGLNFQTYHHLHARQRLSKLSSPRPFRLPHTSAIHPPSPSKPVKSAHVLFTSPCICHTSAMYVPILGHSNTPHTHPSCTLNTLFIARELPKQICHSSHMSTTHTPHTCLSDDISQVLQIPVMHPPRPSYLPVRHTSHASVIHPSVPCNTCHTRHR